jgi:chromosome segregation ATPase
MKQPSTSTSIRASVSDKNLKSKLGGLEKELEELKEKLKAEQTAKEELEKRLKESERLLDTEQTEHQKCRIALQESETKVRSVGLRITLRFCFFDSLLKSRIFFLS